MNVMLHGWVINFSQVNQQTSQAPQLRDDPDQVLIHVVGYIYSIKGIRGSSRLVNVALASSNFFRKTIRNNC